MGQEKSSGRKKYGFATRSVHVGNESDLQTGSVSPPIHLTSTYKQDGVGQDRGFDYSRAGNPTRARLEENIASLEGAHTGIAFATGMSAITSLFQLLKSGDHVLVSRNTYGGTYRLARKILERMGLSFDFVDLRNGDHAAQNIRPETKMIFVETPTNPLLELVDLEATATLARKHQLLFAVDNTFMSPYGQRPMEFGVEVVMHSSTKFISGHSDVLGGMLVTSNENIADQLKFIQKSVGAIPSPFDCWLLLRSVKTLDLRFQKQSDTALKIAQWLEERNVLKRVIYPGLKSHPQYDLAFRQQKTPDGKSIFGSMLSIDLGSSKQRDQFLSRLQLFTLAESLGGVESLISNPYRMTHGDIPEDEKEEMGITEGLLRISIGVEDADDLQDDIESALN